MNMLSPNTASVSDVSLTSCKSSSSGMKQPQPELVLTSHQLIGLCSSEPQPIASKLKENAVEYTLKPQNSSFVRVNRLHG